MAAREHVRMGRWPDRPVRHVEASRLFGAIILAAGIFFFCGGWYLVFFGMPDRKVDPGMVVFAGIFNVVCGLVAGFFGLHGVLWRRETVIWPDRVVRKERGLIFPRSWEAPLDEFVLCRTIEMKSGKASGKQGFSPPYLVFQIELRHAEDHHRKVLLYEATDLRGFNDAWHEYAGTLELPRKTDRIWTGTLNEPKAYELYDGEPEEPEQDEYADDYEEDY